MVELVIAWMVENDEEVFPVSAYSVRGYADDYIIIDGNGHSPRDRFLYENFLLESSVKTVYSDFPRGELGADGIQRNVYLKYLQEHHPDAWCLVLDADEVVHDASSIRRVIEAAEAGGIEAISPRMRHFIGDLGHEDATQENHYVPFRLFKVSAAIKYPEVEHSTLTFNPGTKYANTDGIVIWHIGNARNIYRLQEKYLMNLEKSQTHQRSFLDWWFHSQAFGRYPVKEVNPSELPDWFLEHFGLTPDWYYFQDRRLETKHFIDAIHWANHFECDTALEIGCGLGHRVYAMNNTGIEAHGIEYSEWAVKNCPYTHEIKVAHGDLLDSKSLTIFKERYSLVVLYDVLEHVEKDSLSIALENVHHLLYGGGHVLISVPFTNDPNLYNDPTHKIFEDRNWWESQVKNAGFEIVPVPEHFLFRHQLIIGRKA